MSQDATVEKTLSSIILGLAQQLAARDAQLKSERANFVEELAAMKDQHEVMRTERDHALHRMEEVELQRDRLKDEVETVRVAWSTDVERVRMQGKSGLAEEEAVFDRERGEWKRKIELLEQAAVHQATILAQARHETEDWQARHITMLNEWRRHTEEWTLQFSRVGNRLDELAAARTASDSGSSPTVVLTDTSSSKLITEPAFPPKRSRIAVPSGKIERGSAPNRSVPMTCVPLERSLRSQNGLTNSVTHPSDGSSIHPRQSRKRTRPPSQTKAESCSAPRPSMFSQSTMPADRVIITAHYEVKTEEDEDSADSSLLVSHAYHASSGSGERDEHEEPVPKRRKRAVDDDDDTKYVVPKGDEDAQTRELGAESRGKDDFDEMAIGAEDNHKEVYGHRRVNVREINVQPRTPPYRANISHSSGSSSLKRKAALANGRPTVAKMKR